MPSVLFLLTPLLGGVALAQDAEPNDSQAEASAFSSNALFHGLIDASLDPDDYYTFAGADGTYEAGLDETGTTGVALTLETASGTVASGSYLSASVSAGTTYYLHVSASSGGALPAAGPPAL